MRHFQRFKSSSISSVNASTSPAAAVIRSADIQSWRTGNTSTFASLNHSATPSCRQRRRRRTNTNTHTTERGGRREPSRRHIAAAIETHIYTLFFLLFSSFQDIKRIGVSLSHRPLLILFCTFLFHSTPQHVQLFNHRRLSHPRI